VSHTRKIAHTFALILALVFPVTALRADPPVTTFEIVKRDVGKEITKTGVELIHNLAALVGDDPVLRSKVSQDLIDAVRSLDGQAAALQEFVENLGNIRSADQLKRLASGNNLRAYAASLKEFHLARFIQGDGLLKTIVGQGEGAADQAGGNAINLLRRVEKEIADTGAISPQLDKRLAAALRQLPPDRARAARQLVRNKLVAKGSKLIDVFMRSGADSLFVLTDVVAINAMEDGAGKATAATETAIGFGLELTGNAAVRAFGGGFFLHGLVVSLSAAKVAELASEIMLLQFDLEDAAKKEVWAENELRIDAISGMLRVDALIKAGQYSKAQTLLTKVKHFYFNRPLLAQGDDLYAKMQELEQKANRAEQLMRANQVIAEARIPYLEGYRLAHQGRLLGQAHNLVVEAEKILHDSVGIYPELNAQLTQVRRLLAVIDRIRAKAAPLGKPTISGPDRVAAGEVATFEVALTGGTPDYQPVGVNGIALPTGALLYWTAPQKVGMATLTARLRDDNGSTVEVQKRIEVVTTETQTINDELRLWAYTVSPSYREDGVTLPSKEVEAHDVHTWDDVHFQANIKNSDYQYRWSVNGKVETSPDVSHYYYLRPEAEGVYRIVLSVTDARGKSIGAAEWTIRVTDFKPDYSGPSIYDGVIPEGDKSSDR